MPRKLKNFILNYDNIVIGGNLQAAIFAYNNDFPLMWTELKPHQIWESTLVKAHQDLIFPLSLSGKIPFSNKILKIRFKDNTATVVLEATAVMKIKFNKAHIFDDDKLEGLNAAWMVNPRKYLVIDWFDVHSGFKHDIDKVLNVSDHFVYGIYFYNKEQNSNSKNVAAVSLMTKEELYDPTYSDTISKLVVIDEMKKKGIKGYKKYFIRNKQYYEPIELEINNREVIHMFYDRRVSTEIFQYHQNTDYKIKDVDTKASYYKRELEKCR